MATKKKRANQSLFSFFKCNVTLESFQGTGPDDDESPPPTKKFALPSVVPEAPMHTSPLSREERLHVEIMELEVESKLVAKRFGVERLGWSWFIALRDEFKKPYIDTLLQFLAEERCKYRNRMYPPAKDLFNWTLPCNIHDVKVVILGQYPHHGPEEADSFAFSSAFPFKSLPHIPGVRE